MLTLHRRQVERLISGSAFGAPEVFESLTLDVPMSFHSYVKFDSGCEVHRFLLNSLLPSTLAAQEEVFLRLLPVTPGEIQTADVEKLISICGEIVEVLEAQPDPDRFACASPYDELLGFLEESSHVNMVRRAEPQTLDQLIECACEGGLEDPWVKQFVSTNPELYRSKLQELLNDPQNSENCFAIIRLLLLCFPREKVEPAINAFLRRTEDVDLKEQAMFLLMVFDNSTE